MRTRFGFLSAAPLSAVLALGLAGLGAGACTVEVNPDGSGGTPAGSGAATATGGVPGAGGESVSSGGQTAAGAAPNSGGSGSGGDPLGGGGGPSGGASSGGGESAGGASGGSDSAGGSGGASDCTPDPAGTFVVDGDVVFDEATCLTWMKANTSGDPYAAAVAYCDGLSLGGYDDWRLPTAGEVVSIFKCMGTFPPVEDVFTVMGDGVWSTAETGTIAGDLPKVCGAGQSSGQFYDFGQVGAQNTRCVRGPVTLPDRTACKTNTSICP